MLIRIEASQILGVYIIQLNWIPLQKEKHKY